MPDIKTIADKADIIVNGYAFTREEDGIHVLNLNSPDKAVVFSVDGEVLVLPIFHIILCGGVYACACQR